MSDKSPRQAMSKKPGKSLQERRADKRVKQPSAPVSTETFPKDTNTAEAQRLSFARPGRGRSRDERSRRCCDHKHHGVTCVCRKLET